MIRRFFHADPDVVASLARAVQSLPKVLVITQLRGARDMPVEERTPFRELLACVGDRVDILTIIDEGKPEGMWRDPLGSLCDRLFAGRPEASAASSGYVLTRLNSGLAVQRKALWDPLIDVENLTAFLAEWVPGIQVFERPRPEPEPAPRPRGPDRRETPIMDFKARKAGGRNQAVPDDRHDTDEIPAVEVPLEEPPTIDAYAVLGIEAGVPFEVVKATYRQLIMRYHPDRTSRLPEAERAAADDRAREVNVAFEILEKALNP